MLISSKKRQRQQFSISQHKGQLDFRREEKRLRDYKKLVLGSEVNLKYQMLEKNKRKAWLIL